MTGLQTRMTEEIVDAAILSNLRIGSTFKRFISFVCRDVSKSLNCEYWEALQKVQATIIPYLHSSLKGDLSPVDSCLRATLLKGGRPSSLPFIYDNTVKMLIEEKLYRRLTSEAMVSERFLDILKERYRP